MCYVCARKTLASLKAAGNFPTNDAEQKTADVLERLSTRDDYVNILTAIACVFAASDSAYVSLLNVVNGMRQSMGENAGYIEVHNEDFDEVDRIENRPKATDTFEGEVATVDGIRLAPGSKRTDN